MRGVRNIYSSRLNKKGQFFILSAVIIASIIVSLATTKNYVTTGDAPKKFYYYSQQLEDETGAVVDYALYNDPTGTNVGNARTNLNNFLQQGIDRTLASDPNMEIFACYSKPTDTNSLICQNNGTKSVVVNTTLFDSVTVAGSKSSIKLYGDFGEEISSFVTLSISGKNLITITPDGSKSYNIPLQSSSVQRSQFYFLLKMNSSSGDYISDSSGTKKNS